MCKFFNIFDSVRTIQYYDPYYYLHRYSYGEPIPYRFSNDAYIEKLLFPLNRNVVGNIGAISYYNEPAKKFTGKYADERQCTTQYCCDTP